MDESQVSKALAEGKRCVGMSADVDELVSATEDFAFADALTFAVVVAVVLRCGVAGFAAPGICPVAGAEAEAPPVAAALAEDRVVRLDMIATERRSIPHTR